MTTWSEFLAEVRADLQDTGTTPRFTDKMIYIYAKDAIRDYSIWFPRRVDQALLTLSGASYPLPTDFISEIQVECPVGTFLERRSERPGTRFPNNKQRVYYFLQGGNLYLVPLKAPVYLTYLATHPVPTSETGIEVDNIAPIPDVLFSLTIPDADIELIRIYVKAKVYTQMRTRQSALDRFKTSGARDDNPLEPETQDLMEEYHKKIAERISGGYISLYRPGRSV
jgi:hypothetical protein